MMLNLLLFEFNEILFTVSSLGTSSSPDLCHMNTDNRKHLLQSQPLLDEDNICKTTSLESNCREGLPTTKCMFYTK